MYTYTPNNLIPENRTGWKSAAEIAAAAHKHEQNRYRMLNEFAAMNKAQPMPQKGQKNIWLALLKAPLRLLALLNG